MSKNNDVNSDRDIANKFDALFEAIPELETDEEANQFLIENGYNPDDLRKKGERIVKSLMEDNWRFVSEEMLESETSKILSRTIQVDLPRETLMKKIQEITQALTEKGVSSALATGFAHRNLDKESNKDLASLLRQVQHIADEAGIELREE